MIYCYYTQGSDNRRGIEYQQMGILDYFKKKRVSKNKAIAFVDYEHWYYSLKSLYRLKPDPITWRRSLEPIYFLTDIMVFADFSHKGIKEEIPKIRTVTNTIIETQNTFSGYKKDMTDFIILDYIYQYVADHPETGTIILFTGDGHFQSVVKYITQRLGRKVIVYGIKDAFSTQLKNVATEAIEVPAKEDVLKSYYPMIVSNLAYITEKVNIVPTFQGTTRAVANRNDVPEDLVHAALAEMITKGLVERGTQKVGFNKTIKTIHANWDALVEAGLWSYN